MAFCYKDNKYLFSKDSGSASRCHIVARAKQELVMNTTWHAPKVYSKTLSRIIKRLIF